MFTLIIIVVTCLVSFMAMNDPQKKFNLLFYPEKIKRTGEWHRFLTSGFVHADYMHLLFNMITLYSLGSGLEATFIAYHPLGRTLYVMLYFGCMIAADIPLYIKQKNNPGYMSLGASGAVLGIVFSFILFHPMAMFYGFVPAFIFGFIYLYYSYYASKRGLDNIAHDVHISGAIFGILFTLFFFPEVLHKFPGQIASFFSRFI